MNEVSLFYTRGQIFDSDKQKVCNLCEPYDKNSNIIVSSVNNTYAKGINPEAVEDMHNLLLSIRRQDFEIDDLTKHSIAIVLDKAQKNKSLK